MKVVKYAIDTGGSAAISPLKPGTRKVSSRNMSGSITSSTSGAHATSARSTAGNSPGAISGSYPPPRAPSVRYSTYSSRAAAGSGSAPTSPPPYARAQRAVAGKLGPRRDACPAATKWRTWPIAATPAPSTLGHHVFVTYQFSVLFLAAPQVRRRRRFRPRNFAGGGDKQYAA